VVVPAIGISAAPNVAVVVVSKAEVVVFAVVDTVVVLVVGLTMYTLTSCQELPQKDFQTVCESIGG